MHGELCLKKRYLSASDTHLIDDRLSQGQILVGELMDDFGNTSHFNKSVQLWIGGTAVIQTLARSTQSTPRENLKEESADCAHTAVGRHMGWQPYFTGLHATSGRLAMCFLSLPRVPPANHDLLEERGQNPATEPLRPISGPTPFKDLYDTLKSSLPYAKRVRLDHLVNKMYTRSIRNDEVMELRAFAAATARVPINSNLPTRQNGCVS
jgi:hypothetical protein